MTFSFPEHIIAGSEEREKRSREQDGKRRRVIGWKRARVRSEQCAREPRGRKTQYSPPYAPR